MLSPDCEAVDSKPASGFTVYRDPIKNLPFLLGFLILNPLYKPFKGRLYGVNVGLRVQGFGVFGAPLPPCPLTLLGVLHIGTQD